MIVCQAVTPIFAHLPCKFPELWMNHPKKWKSSVSPQFLSFPQGVALQ
jgi:hypothetical protein